MPGGAGVFEAIVLTLAATGVATQRTALITALVMFRTVYYLLPLIAAVVVGGLSELLPHRQRAAPRERTSAGEALSAAVATQEAAHVH